MAIDTRRLNTAQSLTAGTLTRAPLRTKCPDVSKLVDVDEEDLTAATLRAGLESGGLDAPMYYGCWLIWKTDAGFSGELMQYRALTDQFDGLSLDAALIRAHEWAAVCYG